MTGIVGLPVVAKILGIGDALKEAAGSFFKGLFSPVGLKILLVVVITVGLFIVGRIGMSAYQKYTEGSVLVEVLTKENARVKRDQQEQAKQYQEDLKTQQEVLRKITLDQTRQIEALADRIDRNQKVERDFAAAQKDIADAPPEDDAPAAPVLDGAIDFLRQYEEAAADARPGGGGDTE